MEEITHSLWINLGAVGLLVAALAVAIVALWRRDLDREKSRADAAERHSANYEKMLLAYNEALVGSTAATVEVGTLVRIEKSK